MIKEIDEKPMTTQELRVFISEELCFCGCGAPTETLKQLKEILELFHNKDEDAIGSDYFSGHEKVMKKIFADNYFTYSMFIYYLDKAGITEHGSSLTYSWLDETGRKFLAGLRECDIDNLLEADFCAHGYDFDDHCPDCPKNNIKIMNWGQI